MFFDKGKDSSTKKFDWKKVVIDVLKVLAGAVLGVSVEGCASMPVIFF